MVTTLTSPTHVQNRITYLTKQSIFFSKDIFHIDKLAVQCKLYMIGLKAVWHRAVPLRPQTRETGGVLLQRTQQGPKLYQVEFDSFYYIPPKYWSAIFFLIFFFDIYLFFDLIIRWFVKIRFEIDKNSSSSKLIFQTWFFKNQVQKGEGGVVV